MEIAYLNIVSVMQCNKWNLVSFLYAATHCHLILYKIERVKFNWMKAANYKGTSQVFKKESGNSKFKEKILKSNIAHT